MSVQSRHAAARPRRRMPKAARREQILGAALRAFGRGGYHGTHVDDVVREAGVARGTFYLHFASKRDVFAALVDRMLEVFLAARAPEGAFDVRTRAEAEAAVRASSLGVLDTFRRHRDLARLFFEEAAGLDKGFQDRIERHYDAWRERLRGTIRLLASRGLVRQDLDPDLAAEAILGMYERVTRRFVFAGRDAVPLETLRDALSDFELRILMGR